MQHKRIAGSVVVGIAAAALACGTAQAASADTVSRDERLQVGIAPGVEHPGNLTDQPVVAAPASTIGVDIAPGVRYAQNTTDNSAVIQTPFGSVTTQGSRFQVLDDQGKFIAGQPLTVQRDTATWPAAARSDHQGVSPAPGDGDASTVSVSRRVTTSAWETTARVLHTASTASVPSPVSVPSNPVDTPAKPVDQQADIETALGMVATNFGLATGVGGMVGGVAGVAVGCPLGVVTGGALTAPTVVGTPLGMIGGCLIGASIVGSVGAIVGGAVVGIPVGIASATQAYNSLHAAGDM